MRTLYESILDDIDTVAAKSEKYMTQQKMIEDVGLYEINPMTSGGGSADWLKKLKIKTDYTNLFEPYVKKQKNWFKKHSVEYSGLVGIIFNMLLMVKNSKLEIYPWDDFHPSPKPDGLLYMEKIFKKQYHCDIQVNCSDMVDSGNLVIRLEFYNPDSSSFFYLYFNEDKFYKYIA